MSKNKTRSLVTLALIAALGGLALAAPATASAAEARCVYWNDDSTYGGECTGVQEYYVRAKCSNGEWYRGPWVRSGWTYVYCSTYGATYVRGSGQIVAFG